ncbi:hypothetical protein P12x_002346 [Tundrisphaera lichenicola]|uniref:hypothetical protein n=1 Tax=Tundrisphaera lichenicola TaxID=2029860 RepID=UPI003EC11936
MHVDFFDWDDEDFEQGNTRHILSAGFDPDEIEEAILTYRGPVARTRETDRPMIRTTTSDGEEIIIIFEIEADDDLVVVRPITAFPQED